MADTLQEGSVQDRHLTDSQIMQNRIEAALYPEPVEEPNEPELDQEIEEVEESEEPADQEIEEAETEEAEEEEPDTETEEALSFETVDELAEALEMKPEDFLGTIKTKVKVDGEEFEVNLSELKNGYQRDSDYRKKTMELADSRKAFVQESEAQKAEIGSRLEQVNALIDNLQTQILNEFQGIDWNQLRNENPGEYSAMVQDFQSRQLQLQQIQQVSQAEAEKLQKEQQAKQQEQYRELLAAEREALLEEIPEWKDSKVMTEESKKLTDFLKLRGFNEQEINYVADHRIIKMARDLMKSDTVVKKADIVKSKLKNLPKLVKPGAKKTQNTVLQEKQQKLRAKIKKTGGRVQDITELLMDRM